MDVIRFACGQCGKSIKVDAKFSGRKGRCPDCKGEFTVPGVEAPGGGSAVSAPAAAPPPLPAQTIAVQQPGVIPAVTNWPVPQMTIPYSVQPRKKQPLLSWWAGIAFVVLMVVEAIFGWPYAKTQGSDSSFVIGYFTGEIFAALLTSLLVAWIVYLIAKRSQMVGSAVFTGMMVLCCCTVVDEWAKSRLPSGHGGSGMNAAQVSVPKNYPLAGISLAAPTGWQRLAADAPTTVTRWISPESNESSIRAMVMVEIKRVDPPSTVQEIAKTIANQWGGSVVDRGDMLDGEHAWRIVGNSSTGQTKPVSGLVAEHNGTMYMIDGVAVPGYSCQEAMDYVRDHWKWTAVESPVHDLEFRDQATPILNGKVLINYPALMEVVTAGLPSGAFGLKLPDYTADEGLMETMVQETTIAEGDTMAAMEDRVSKQLQKDTISEALVWHALENSKQGAITEMATGTAEGGPNWVIVGYIQLDHGRVVLVNFEIRGKDAAERAVYARTAEKIVESISAKD